MKDRIKQIRKNENLTLEKFGKRIGITAASCSNIESGKTNASSQTVLAICREFGVSENWLLTGEGDMKEPRTKEEEIADLVGQALNGSSEFKLAVVKMICSRTDNELKTLEAALRSIYENL